MNKIIVFKTLDRLFGIPLSFFLGLFRSRKPARTDFKRVLIIRPGGMGDAVLLIPAITHIKNVFPDISVDILCEKRNASVFTLVPAVKDIFCYDTPFQLFKCLKNGYDAVIDTEQWHRLTAIVSFLSFSPVRIGFATNERKRLFTSSLDYDHEDYEVYSFLKLAVELTGAPANFDRERPFLAIDPTLPESIDLPENITTGLILLFPGATVNERKWNAENFGVVACALHRKGYTVAVIGGKTERAAASKIITICPSVIDLTGKTSLAGTASVIKRSKLLISTDSGILHLAYAIGTPTVSLFGAGRENKWAPPGKSHCAVNEHLECSPCTKFGYTPSCRTEIKCLSRIDPDRVLSTALRLLAEHV